MLIPLLNLLEFKTKPKERKEQMKLLKQWVCRNIVVKLQILFLVVKNNVLALLEQSLNFQRLLSLMNQLAISTVKTQSRLWQFLEIFQRTISSSWLHIMKDLRRILLIESFITAMVKSSKMKSISQMMICKDSSIILVQRFIFPI